MNRKKFSRILFEARTALDLSPIEMSFILDMPDQVYKRYEKGQFDKTYSVRKDRIIEKLNSIDFEIEKKILFLKRALRKFQQQKNGKKTGKPHHQNLKNLK